MATLRFIQPYLNPIQFYEQGLVRPAQYRSKHMDDWPFTDTILPWQEGVTFLQPWQINDTIKLQFRTNYGPLTLGLYSCDDQLIHSVSVQQKHVDRYDPTMYIYEVDLSLQAFDPGYYYLKLNIGNPVQKVLFSEPLIISDFSENTILLEYTNRRFYGEVFFETGFSPSFRVYGTITYKGPESQDTIYTDQEYNAQMLKAVPYDLWNLSLGGSAGQPPWVIKKVNRMMGCNITRWDGRQYTKNDGARFEENTVEFYPMSGWSIELRETLNRGAGFIEDDISVVGEMNVVLVTDTKGFGNQSGGSNYFVNDIS